MLKPGSLAALDGPLGAGKTCLVKGIAWGLGVKEEITSPTWTIVSEYEAAMEGRTVPFYHIDAYRLGGVEDFYALGGEEIIYSGGIAVVEWAEQIREALSGEAIRIRILLEPGGERRISWQIGPWG